MYRDIILQIIDAAINGKTLDLSNYINDQEFMRIMKEQTFLPFLYKVDKRKEFRKYYYQSCLIHEKFNEVGKLVDDILTRNNIPHVFLKGYELQNLYPDSNLRMLGDIDLLVENDYFEQTKNIISTNGFIFDMECEHHIGYKKEDIEIELHNKLFDKEECSSKLFDNTFNNIRIKDFDDTFTLLYVIAHYAKHIKMGAGLRPIIDIYLIIKNKKINLDILLNKLKELNLMQFFNTILDEIYIIFNDNLISHNSTNLANNLIDYSLKKGIHGYAENGDPLINRQINDKGKGNKFIFLFSKIFPSIEIIKNKYEKYYHWFSIPFLYIINFFSLFKKIKNLSKLKNYNKNDYELLKQLNLCD